MNKYKKFLLTFGLFIIVNLFQPLKSNAQPADPGCDPLDPACPIDGGVSLLIAAGIGIAAKKTFDLKNRDNKKI